MSCTVTVEPDVEKARKTKASFEVPASTYKRFKASCGLHGQTMSERLAEIMAADAAASGIPAGTS